MEFPERTERLGEIRGGHEQVIVIRQDAPGMDRRAGQGDRGQKAVTEFGHALLRHPKNRGVVQTGGCQEMGSVGMVAVGRTVPGMGMVPTPLEQGLLLSVGQTSPQVGHGIEKH